MARSSAARHGDASGTPGRREQILLECVAAIAENGFAATSMREIAKRAGVSLGTLVHHFPSKDELVLECLNHVWTAWASEAERILSSDGPALARVDQLIDCIVGADVHDDLWRVWEVLGHEGTFDERLRAESSRATQTWDGLLSGTIEEAVRDGDLAGDPKALARALSTLMNGVATDLHSGSGRWTREQGAALCKWLVRSDVAT
jgi:AcrR family transcriptional regulator